jgi:hypothetical protein
MQHKNRVMQRPKTPGQHLAFPLIIYLACSISIVATFTTLVFSKEGSHKSLGHYHTSLFAKKKKRGTTITICLLFRVSYFYMRVVCFFQPYTRVSDDKSFGGIVVVAEMAPAVVALVKQLLLL